MQDKTVPQPRTTGGFPGFAPGEHRDLLVNINRWRRRQDWTWGHIRGLVNAKLTREATIAVDWLPADENSQGFTVTRRERAGSSWPVPDFYRAVSIRQAVDLLVVLDVLPLAFSSQWQRGVTDGRWIEGGWGHEDGAR